MHYISMLKKSGFGLLILTLVTMGCKHQQQQAPPPPKIQVVEVNQSDVPIYQEFVGQVYGLYDIPIRARVEGWLEGQYFEEGTTVNKGQLLYTIDSESYEATVAANLSMVAQAETELVKAQSDLGRIAPLAKINAVSQSDLDAATAAEGAAKASLDAAKANLDAANIQLSYCKIHSPLNGIIGKTLAKVGEFVGRDPNPVILNTVSRVDSIHVQFFISESQFLTVAKEFIQEHRSFIKPESDKQLAKNKDLQLILSDGTTFSHMGWIDFIDREIDPNTGSILLQATFPNPERLLRPGQFARVKGKMKEVKDGLLIPQRCIMELQGQFNVFVVDSSNKIKSVQVQVGPTIGSDWLITSGLSAGEKVVYEGLQSVKIGMVVDPQLVTPETNTENDGE